MSVHRLRGIVRDYPWGSPDAIPRLTAMPVDGAPVAELWFGAHPGGPARLADAGPGEHADLRSLVRAAPETVLGEDVVSRFGGRLPYLLKLVAPAHPLSMQVHPDLDRARRGYAAENARGVPLDARERNYKDPNHKPELLLALTTFEAVSGFRAPRRAAELLAGLDAPLARTLHGILRADPSAAGMCAAFTLLLGAGSRPSAAEVGQVARACARRLADGSPSPRADGTVVLLAEAYPGDPGAVISLLLNPVTLQPGEAMFVPAGGVHAYLSGLAVEIMASSDNTLRAGLTDKHVDVAEVLDCVDYVAAPPIRVAPEVFRGGTKVFYAPVDDFELSVTELAALPSGREHTLPGRGPRILLALYGEVDLRTDGDTLTLAPGDAVFARADEGAVVASGTGTLVEADVP